MLTASAPSLQQDHAYGLGLGVADDPALGPVVAHSGGGLGGRAYLLLGLDRGIAVAIVGNLEGDSLGDAAKSIAGAFADEDSRKRTD